MRETRPARITGCLALRSSSAALADASAGAAALATGGMKRAASIGGSGSASFASCMLGVEIDVSRPARRGVGDPGGAQDRFARGGGRGRLVVPFGVAAHQRALVARGVDPVDPRPALDGIDRPGGAEHDHRHAVAPGVEDRHGGVHQADIGMHRRRHRLAGDLGVAVRDRDRAFLVQAEQHLRLLVAEIIDDAVVQAAIAGAGIERDIGNVERAQRVGDDVAAECRRVDAGGLRTVDGGNCSVGDGLRFGALHASMWSLVWPWHEPSRRSAGPHPTGSRALAQPGEHLQPGIAVGRLHADLSLEGAGWP